MKHTHIVQKLEQSGADSELLELISRLEQWRRRHGNSPADTRQRETQLRKCLEEYLRHLSEPEPTEPDTESAPAASTDANTDATAVEPTAVLTTMERATTVLYPFHPAHHTPPLTARPPPCDAQSTLKCREDFQIFRSAKRLIVN